MTFPFNFIIIPAVIIATAVVGSRYVQRGLEPWYKQLHKPKWTPAGQLIGEIWTFLYILIGLAVLWYWNVPVFSRFHYVVGGILLLNACLNVLWNKVFFVEHNLAKAYLVIKLVIGTAILSAALIAIASPIAAFLMLAYLIWLGLAVRLNKQILAMNLQ